MLRFTLVTAALLASQGAIAQPPVDAGSQIRQIPPAPVPVKPAPMLELAPPAAAVEPGQAGPSVRVAALRVTGATLFPEGELIAASGFRPGQEMNLADMRRVAAAISAYYNARGYFLARAYLPDQSVEGGVVTIAVLEGRYGAIRVDNRSHLSDSVARRTLAGIDSGDIVAIAPLERRLLLLSDLPGIALKSTLAPGSAVGTSDLIVNVMPGRTVTGSVEADNAGNRYTGAYRAGGTINLNNLAGIGDVISLRVLGSSSGLAYGRLSAQAPVGNFTVGAAYAHFRYDLGREFASLEAHGTADVASLYASYPLIRSRDSNLYALAAVDVSWFHDEIDLITGRSDKKSEVVNLGLRGDSHDRLGGGGWNLYSASWAIGNLDLQSPLDRAADALTARSDGGFSKIQYSVARLQSVSGPLSLYAAVRGQFAFDNLDSSEKMELGGAYGVRAYPEGEAYGDQGYVATAEARLAIVPPALPGQLQLIAFVDTGRVRYAHNPWFTTANHARRSGYGAGLAWYAPGNLILRATYARRLGDTLATSGPDRAGRFWFQISKSF
jgi:hemolysin activation/secretion protein